MLLEQFNWKSEVLDSEDPVIVDFWAAWCGPCRMLSPVIERLAHDFKVCKVNVDTNPELAATYRVSSIPTLLVIQHGREVFRHVGVASEHALRDAIERLNAATPARR